MNTLKLPNLGQTMSSVEIAKLTDKMDTIRGLLFVSSEATYRLEQAKQQNPRA